MPSGMACFKPVLSEDALCQLRWIFLNAPRADTQVQKQGLWYGQWVKVRYMLTNRSAGHLL